MRPDDPVHAFTLTDAERWELLHRCLRTIECRIKQTGWPAKSITGVALIYCDVDGLRITRRNRGPQDVTKTDILKLEVLMPMTVPDQATVFSVPLPLTPYAMTHSLWGNWRDGRWVLDIMRQNMVLEDLADIQ